MTFARIAALAVGAAMLVASVGKQSSRSWPVQARALGAPDWSIGVIPWIELVLGSALVGGLVPRIAGSATALLLAAFTAAIVRRLSQGERPPCACFGGRTGKPIGPWSVARNLALIALALTAAKG